jgi:hypothetical protein
MFLLVCLIAVIVGTVVFAYIDAPNARSLPPPRGDAYA